MHRNLLLVQELHNGKGRPVMKSFAVILVFFISEMTYAHTSSLTLLWSLAEQNNPRIIAQKKNVDAMRKMIVPQSLPPDPMLKFSTLNQPIESGVMSPMSSFQIMLSQNIPFPTKLAIKGKIQSILYEIEAARLRLMISELKRDIHLKYNDIGLTTRILSIEKDKLSKIELINSLALTKYELGKGLQQDLLKVSVTQLQIRKKILKLQSMLSAQKYEMQYLLGETTIPSDLEWDDHPIPLFNKDTVLGNAQNLFPLLLIKQKMIEKSKADLVLARWDFLPDLGLTLAYNIRDNSLSDGGVDQYILGVSASVPLFSLFKQLPQSQSRSLSLQSAQFQYKDALINTEQMINMHYEMFMQDKEIVDLYEKNILNESQQSLDSAMTSYQVDKVDFLNVLNSLLSLYQQQEEYQEVRADLVSHQAWLEFLQGTHSNTGVENE